MPYIPHIRATIEDTRSLDSREALDIRALTAPPNLDVLLQKGAIDAHLTPGAPALPLRHAHIHNTQDSQKELAARQVYVLAIPATYQGLNSGPSPGVIVGIVLGSVAGFILLIWLLWQLSNGGSFIRTTGDVEEIDIRRTDRRGKRTRSVRAEMTRAEPRRVYRSERIVRDVPVRSRSSSPRSRVRDSSRIRERETTIVEESRGGERRVEGDDIVEVIEEHSELDPPPRRKSRRSGDYQRSVIEERVMERVVESDDGDERRPISGYRTVDPRQLGGGSFRPHHVR